MSAPSLLEFSPVGNVPGLVDAIVHEQWLPAGLSALAVGIDVGTSVADPLGASLSLGVEWVMEHVGPLTEILDKLAVAPGEARSRAEGVAASASALREELSAADFDRFDGWEGSAALAHRDARAQLLRVAGSTADALTAIARSMERMATVVAAVRTFVRGLIADVVSGAALAGAAAFLSGGTLAPGAVTAVTAHVARAAARALQKVTQVIDAFSQLDRLLVELARGLRELRMPRLASGHAPSHRGMPRWRQRLDGPLDRLEAWGDDVPRSNRVPVGIGLAAVGKGASAESETRRNSPLEDRWGG